MNCSALMTLSGTCVLLAYISHGHWGSQANMTARTGHCDGPLGFSGSIKHLSRCYIDISFHTWLFCIQGQVEWNDILNSRNANGNKLASDLKFWEIEYLQKFFIKFLLLLQLLLFGPGCPWSKVYQLCHYIMLGLFKQISPFMSLCNPFVDHNPPEITLGIRGLPVLKQSELIIPFKFHVNWHSKAVVVNQLFMDHWRSVKDF